MEYLKDILFQNLTKEEEIKIEGDTKYLINNSFKTNKMKIIPIGKKVLIKEQEAPKYFKGSTILIPETAQEKQYKAYIVAVGKEVDEVVVGDLIQYSTYANPTEMFHNDEKHYLINVQDIFAIIIDA